MMLALITFHSAPATVSCSSPFMIFQPSRTHHSVTTANTTGVSAVDNAVIVSVTYDSATVSIFCPICATHPDSCPMAIGHLQLGKRWLFGSAQLLAGRD